MTKAKQKAPEDTKPSEPEPVKLPERYDDFNYDDWLEFFRKIPPAELMKAQDWLMRKLPNDGYAAAARWLEIAEQPSKMDKLHQGKLKAEQDKNVQELAIGDNDEAFYEALIQENVAQLNAGSISPQEVARISQNINIFRKELREIRSRKPKKGTTLEKVLKAANQPKKRATKSRAKASKSKKTITKPSRRKNGSTKAPRGSKAQN